MLDRTTLENTTQSKKVLVEVFGEEGHKRNFYKKNKFTGGTEDSFIKTLEQHFTSIEKVKVGKSIHYKLGDARKKLAKRSTGKNASNGNWKGSTKHLDALILAHLEHNLENNEEIENTHMGWLLEFGLVNLNSLALHKSAHDRFAKKEVKNLIMNNTRSYEPEFIKHMSEILSDDLNSIKTSFKSALERMESEGIIKLFNVPKAKLQEKIRNNNGILVTAVDLDVESYQRYKRYSAKLLDSLELTPQQSQANPKHYKSNEKLQNNIIEYNKKMREFLTNNMYFDNFGTPEKIKVDFIWENLAIVVEASHLKSMEYLNKYHHDILVEYENLKKDDYEFSQVEQYRAERKEERYQRAQRKSEDKIKKAQKEHEENKAFGSRSFEVELEQSRERHYLWAISILDEVFGDAFKITKKD